VKKLLPVLSVVMLLALCGCVQQPSFSIIPAIKLKSLSKTVVTLPSTSGITTDTILVTLSFTDGDGDIGIPDGLIDTTCANCYCTNHGTDAIVMSNTAWDIFYYAYTSGFTDSCISIPGIGTKYIPNNSKYNALQGDITFSLQVECGPTGPVDTVSYSFFIKDRAGHFSNRVKSPNIIINCN
jgi:hypothetical protein